MCLSSKSNMHFQSPKDINALHCTAFVWFLKCVDLQFFGLVLFCFAFFSGELISLNQTGINMLPHLYAPHSWLSSHLEVWHSPQLGEGWCWKALVRSAESCPMDRARVDSSFALKQSYCGTANNGPKAQAELTRMAFQQGLLFFWNQSFL